MSLRPIQARWFELVTVHKDLPAVLECLSRTACVELEAGTPPEDALVYPDLEDALKPHRELARRYRHHWPAPAHGRRRTEHLHETLATAHGRLTAWSEDADPLIVRLEALSQEIARLKELRAALDDAPAGLPDLAKLASAGPKLAARLIALPAGVLPREMPAAVLYRPWHGEAANYAVVLGRPEDVAEIEAQMPALKAQAIALPDWLPARPQDAVTAITERLASLTDDRKAAQDRLAAFSEHHEIAEALGDIALVEWMGEHGKHLRGSERLAWVTGWTCDLTSAQLRKALDACHARYILRLAEAPSGIEAPQVLDNPGWARAFEVFPRMLGTPGRHESDPSQILAIIASAIFGFMFADVGQGVIVVVAGLVLGKRYPLMRMLVPGGIMAMVFGVLFGSVFCREDVIAAAWLKPMADPITILIAAVATGIAIIAVGLSLDALQMHWRDEAAQWWGHRAGLLLAYAGVLISPFWLDGLLLAAAGALWYIAGAGLLVKAERVAALLSAAAEFIEEGLRLLVNTVSFVRIGAFALAHAGLSAAIVEMAGAAGPVGYWIVLVLGNVLVIALEGVVVSIQTTRLLLFEFFIRFLTGTGRSFKPLSPPGHAHPVLHEPTLRGTS
jgi:V/A-type H+-transporting ATPase subunit I